MQLLCACCTPTLGLLCPVHCLPSTLAIYWVTVTHVFLHRATSEQDFLSNSLFQLLGAMDKRPESLSALCF